MASDEYLGAGEVAAKDAGSVEPVTGELPHEDAPYQAPPREEPGPEAIPPAVIEREFQPISDVGAPTAPPDQYPPGRPNGTGTGDGGTT